MGRLWKQINNHCKNILQSVKVNREKLKRQAGFKEALKTKNLGALPT